MQRQQSPLGVRHAAAIYIYSYEMDHDEPQDQIYAAMNAAMRLHDPRGIAFWRPLIWEIDVALQQLPGYDGRLYRGINCRFDADTYRTGRTVCWPSFSSASQTKGVAQEFATGAEGSLFFLQSVRAVPISAISRFPDEAEVLFRPNTTFKITSTLQVRRTMPRSCSSQALQVL